MRYFSSSVTLLLLMLLGGCGTAKQSGEYSYSGKVEVVQDGKVLTSRDYVYREHEVPIAPSLLPHSFRVVEKGTDVAVLKVYWPTWGLEKSLEKASRQVTGDVEKGLADKQEKETGQTAPVKSSFSCTVTSTYKLIKDDGNRYSLCDRGSDDAEHYGYYAENDKEATDIALTYLIRFVVPLSIGEDVYEARRDGSKLPSAMSDDQK